MIVVGLDVSLNATGVARIDTDSGHTRTRTLKVGTRRGHARNDFVLNEVSEEIRGASLVVLEGYAYGSRTPTVPIHELTGLLKHQVWRRGVAYGIVPPSNLKAYVTGEYNAGKLDMMRAMQRAFPGILLSTDDEADALALATMGCRWQKLVVDAHVQRWAHEIQKCQWPDGDGEPRAPMKKRAKPRFSD